MDSPLEPSDVADTVVDEVVIPEEPPVEEDGA